MWVQTAKSDYIIPKRWTCAGRAWARPIGRHCLTSSTERASIRAYLLLGPLQAGSSIHVGMKRSFTLMRCLQRQTAVTFVQFYIVCGCVGYIASVFSEPPRINKTQKLGRGLLFTRTLMAFFFLVLCYDILLHHGKKGPVSFTVFGCFSGSCCCLHTRFSLFLLLFYSSVCLHSSW